MENLSVGDVVISTAGRDKGNLFLVVKIETDRAFIADGKIRKINNLKKKNVKHLKKIGTANEKEIAEKIERGEPVSGVKLKRLLCAKYQ